jgi:hypothetical protein
MSEKALYMVAAESQGSSDKRYFSSPSPSLSRSDTRSSRLQSTPAKKHVGHQQKGNPAKADTMVMSPSRSSNRCVSTSPRPFPFLGLANPFPERRHLLLLSRKSTFQKMIYVPSLRSNFQGPKRRAVRE